MKRKSGRKGASKKEEENSNGVEADTKSDQNGDTSEHEEDDAPKSKRKKSSKKATVPAKKAETSGESEKSEEEGLDEVEIKAPRGRKSKQDKEDPLAGLGESDIVEETEKKKIPKKGGKKQAQKLQEPVNSEEQTEDDLEENENQYEKKKTHKKGSKKQAQKQQKPDIPEEQTEDELEEDENQYEVEEILGMKNVKGVLHYLIRWKGYGEESDTWEPAKTLNCPDLIKAYKEKNKKEKKEKKDIKVPQWDENEHFEVDRILEVHHKRDGKREFLVHWKGYPMDDNSWEPEENMDCKDVIARFMAKVEKAKNLEEKELRVNRRQVQRYTLATTEHGRRLSRRHANKERVQYHDAE